MTFDKVGNDWTVTASELTVNGAVSGIDKETFARAADGAKDGCPISRVLKANVKVSVKATLSERAEARA